MKHVKLHFFCITMGLIFSIGMNREQGDGQFESPWRSVPYQGFTDARLGNNKVFITVTSV